MPGIGPGASVASMETEGPGAKFWLVLVGSVIAGGIAALILFGLFGLAWYAWGGFAAFMVFVALILVVAFLYDRREAKQYEEMPEA
jgi:Flp pilus assembly protein TadB